MADFEKVCSKIDEEKEFLNFLSQQIWKMPELMYKEIHAHALLTNALTKHGFKVEKHYLLTTSFRAEYVSKSKGGPTIALLCEYDALPEIGHACGHNLIAEAGVAAGIAIKSLMESDSSIVGKVVVLGTPAEEGGGGKIRLLELGAFDDIDVAMMAHPSRLSSLSPVLLSNIRLSIEYKGKEAHAAACPWEGRNALDAAVACYTNIALLRQQVKPTCRIHGIITKGGVAVNIIPAYSRLEYSVRACTTKEVKQLLCKIKNCMTSAAEATGCEMSFRIDETNGYKNLITNSIVADLFEKYAKKLGMEFKKSQLPPGGSSDMGNVSHAVPSIHPFYIIPTSYINHTKEFADAAGSSQAQKPTLIVAKAMALTAIHLMRHPDVMVEVTQNFQKDIAEQ